MVETYSFRLVDTGAPAAVKFMEEWGDGGYNDPPATKEDEMLVKPLNLTNRGTSVSNLRKNFIPC